MTKFKNKDLLIKVLDKCIALEYHTSEMLNIRYIIIYHNETFEQAFSTFMRLYARDTVYRTISRIYHNDIRVLNMNKSFKRSANNV